MVTDVRYMGSKTKIHKEILDIIKPENRGDRFWVEPFVGGGNMIDNVEGNRIGSDAFYHAVNALKLMRDRVNDLPKSNKEHTKEDHLKLREDDTNKFKSWLGFASSFGGKFLDCYASDSEGDRDYVNEQYRAAVKQSEKLQGVKLVHCSYDELEIPENSIIYCDPPYKGTTKYKLDFDHDKFWDWVRVKANDGFEIYVSEYSAPDDFKCIWEKSVNVCINKESPNKRTEKLFVLKVVK